MKSILVVPAVVAMAWGSVALADDDHDDHSHDHDDHEVSDLSAWQGDWVSAHVYLEDPAGGQMVSDIAGHIGSSEAAVLQAFEEMLVTSFTHMDIDGDQVTYTFDGSAVTCTYDWHGVVDLWFEGTAYPWYAFVTDDVSCAEQEYLILGMAHGEGSSRHYHLRYGAGDPQAVMDDESIALWYPSYFPASLTAAEFAAEMSPADSEMTLYIASLLSDDDGHEHSDDHGHEHADDHDHGTPESPAVGNGGLVAAGNAGGSGSVLMLTGIALMALSLGAGATVFVYRRS